MVQNIFTFSSGWTENGELDSQYCWKALWSGRRQIPACPKLQWRLQQSEPWQRARWGGWKALKNILSENSDSFVLHGIISSLSLAEHMTRTLHYCDNQMLQESSLPPWVAFSLCKAYTKKTVIFLLWSWSHLFGPRLQSQQMKSKYFCQCGHQVEPQSWRASILLRSSVCLFPVENSSISCQQRVLKFNGTRLPRQEAAQWIPVRLQSTDMLFSSCLSPKFI